MNTKRRSVKLDSLLEKLTAQGFVPDCIVRAPGRANIIGEHVDYCEGLVLPFAIEQSMYFVAQRREASRIRIISEDYQSEWTVGQEMSSAWMAYCAQIVKALQRRSLSTEGCVVYITSDIPIGAGVSSSSALCCGFLFLLNELNDWQLSREELIELASEAEHGLGLNGGKMDQYSIFFGEEGKALLLDCVDHSYTEVDIDPSVFRFLLIDSGVQHSLVTSDYNSRRAQAERALVLVREIDSEATFRNLTQEHLELLTDDLLEQKRLRHIRSEISRVEQAVEAIRLKDPLQLGQLLLASHYSLRDDYEVSCPEIDTIVEQLEKDSDVYGARMMGGGFGGSVLCLVKEGSLQDAGYIENLYSKTYEKQLLFHPIQSSKGTENAVFSGKLAKF